MVVGGGRRRVEELGSWKYVGEAKDGNGLIGRYGVVARAVQTKG